MNGARQLLTRWVESHDAGFPGGAVLASKVCEDTRRFLDDDNRAMAGALDVERLARAMEEAWDSEIHQPLHSVDEGRGYFQLRPAPGLAARIAAAYAAETPRKRATPTRPDPVSTGTPR